MNRARLRALTCASALLALSACSSEDPASELPIEADASFNDREGGPEADAAVSGKPDASEADAAPAVATGKSCDRLRCRAPAVCREQDGKARCSCPEGYDDTEGDGSQCEDRNECDDDDSSACDSRASCENTPGGYECKCNAPAYEGDGKTCSCAEGYTLVDGFCIGDDGKACQDNFDCKNRHCVSGICCAVACSTPGEACLSVADATCEDGRTCEYPVASDGTACEDDDACTGGSTCQSGNCERGSTPVDCDDQNPCTDDSCDMTLGCVNMSNAATCDDGNPCTSDDSCMGGSCGGGTPRDCSVLTDGCNSGSCDPQTGECEAQPVANGTLCEDASSCTIMAQCDAGACVGQGNACGPNSSACTPGSPNTCSCDAGFQPEAGVCVPDTNECNTDSPCSPNATCFDPSNAAGDVTCQCRPGFTGNGRECTAVDACAGNPCGEGRGSCVPGEAGTYTCSCSAGFTRVGNTCVCDMSGTFATRNRVFQKFEDVASVEDAEVHADSWTIGRHTYDAEGRLSIEVTSCGGIDPDLCGLGLRGLVAAEAYAQYLPAELLNGALPPMRHQFSLPNAIPGQPYVTGQMAALFGISLTDPLGAWPSRRADVQGSSNFDGSAVNGARWIDTDNDGAPGLTSYTVPPGGVRPDGTPPDPIQSYGATSAACPRSNPSATRYQYNYPPAPLGLSVQRVKRLYVGQRLVSSLEGTLQSCDRVSGDLKGPNGGSIVLNARIAGCVRVNSSGELRCEDSIVDDFLDDGEAQPQGSSTGTFVMRRVPANTTCAEVRALSFD